MLLSNDSKRESVFELNGIFVTSWRMGRRFGRNTVDQNDFDRFQKGDDIITEAKKEAAIIPWIARVFRR